MGCGGEARRGRKGDGGGERGGGDSGGAGGGDDDVRAAVTGCVAWCIRALGPELDHPSPGEWMNQGGIGMQERGCRKGMNGDGIGNESSPVHEEGGMPHRKPLHDGAKEQLPHHGAAAG